MASENEEERTGVNIDEAEAAEATAQASIAEAKECLPPSHVVMDLLSIGVCSRCIMRFFGVRGHVSYSEEESKIVVEDGVKEEKDLNSYDSFQMELESFCCICLGVLQFSYSEGKDVLVKRDNVSEFALAVAETVKNEGYEIDSFSLEISVPPIILANEHAIWLYMKRKYGSELWFQDKLQNGHISLKEALKFSITNSLESLLGAKHEASSFHIRLTYTHSNVSLGITDSQKTDQDHKRRKTGAEDNYYTVASNGRECAENSNGEASAVVDGLQDSEHLKSPPEKVKEPCCLTRHCNRTPVYIGGRYLKYSRNVSQTRWIIDDERKGEASVEEIIGNTVLPLSQGDSYKFHAAGREDIDVRMLGSGRPFLLEVQNARRDPLKVSMEEIEEKINNSEVKLVRVRNVKVVGIEGWNLMREGETEKQKQYAALVWISRPLEDEDLKTISSVKDMQISQRTPVRVLHRRSPLDRERSIHWMKIERIVGSTQYILLHLCTQAGTYIKEFVHGDLGRTKPSIGSILGCRAEILQLDVTDVKMDCFN
ncbi:hypothetical protein AQUCO_04300078v1 [Aquilegia coerulea]|uniref:tRNA pseudouridine(55) synthase n=1 Tax=Aquilegia coerulea TaxID=218851 RepID=A0A2G5CNK0_AQUCA|nr:hypothetical protein AQUCO_04300078v1 [Aquilegia coerulea]PIA32893.1 hypothetical protein AQUCO_04300078v1 [Aquilegia coerulea]